MEQVRAKTGFLEANRTMRFYLRDARSVQELI